MTAKRLTVPEVAANQRTELERLCKRGKLAAQEIERFARNPRTALHTRFVWNDSKAGYLYRLQQAEALIRMVYVILPGPNQEPVRVRAFVSVPSERGEGIYRPIQDVLASTDMLKELEDSLRRELEGMTRQFAAIAKLSPLYQKVVKVLEDVPA